VTETARELSKQAYLKQKEALLKTHPGKFALFSNGSFVDTFDTMEAAYAAAIERCGVDGFYIGHVVPEQKPQSLPALQHGLLRVRL